MEDTFGYTDRTMIEVFGFSFLICKSIPEVWCEKRAYWSLDAENEISLDTLGIDVTKEYITVDKLVGYIKRRLIIFNKRLTKQIEAEGEKQKK